MGEFARAEPDAICPVALDLLGELYRGSVSVPEMLRDLSEDRRVRLALFCYGRAHLRALALVIAETCDAERLGQLAGTLGQVLAIQCRARVRTFGQDFGPQMRQAKKVTLASMHG